MINVFTIVLKIADSPWTRHGLASPLASPCERLVSLLLRLASLSQGLAGPEKYARKG